MDENYLLRQLCFLINKMRAIIKDYLEIQAHLYSKYLYQLQNYSQLTLFVIIKDLIVMDIVLL